MPKMTDYQTHLSPCDGTLDDVDTVTAFLMGVECQYIVWMIFRGINFTETIRSSNLSRLVRIAELGGDNIIASRWINDDEVELSVKRKMMSPD